MPDAARRNPFSWPFVVPLLSGASVNSINSSLIATALVPIAAAIHEPVGRVLILVSVLYLASAVAQPTGGKLAEEFGPRRVFLAGGVVCHHHRARLPCARHRRRLSSDRPDPRRNQRTGHGHDRG